VAFDGAFEPFVLRRGRRRAPVESNRSIDEKAVEALRELLGQDLPDS
jgi:hypothetical protein